MSGLHEKLFIERKEHLENSDKEANNKIQRKGEKWEVKIKVL